LAPVVWELIAHILAAVAEYESNLNSEHAANPYRFVELLTIILPSAHRFGILRATGRPGCAARKV